MKYILIIITIGSVFFSCNSGRKPPIVSFYYWRTTFEVSELERQTLQENDVKKVYVRYFDVDLDEVGNPRPESPVRFKHHPRNLEVVPVVFIKNAVMLSNALDIDSFAENIIRYIDQIDNVSGNKPCKEIQIDCDWTLKSRDRFMQFVDALKKRSGKKLSATIRLHQVKYYKTTQIPNVDNAVLMYYNMGKIASDTLNSIYDRNIALNYVKSLRKYPLSLDIALPIYAWGVHIRDEGVMGLIGKTDKSVFEKDTNFLVDKHSNIIRVKNSNMSNGRYFLRSDKIKIEDVFEKDLELMVKDIKKQLPYTPREVIFFDLDEFNIKKYGNETQLFKDIANRF